MFRILINALLFVALTCWPACAKHYNGAAWVDDACRYYNGSAWVDCAKNRYDGAAWTGIEATANYPHINLWLTFEEGDTTGDYGITGAYDCSQGDTSISYSSSTLAAAEIPTGSNNALYASVNYGYASLDVNSNDIVTPPEGRIGTWFKRESTWGGGSSFRIFQIVAATGKILARWNADGTISAQYYDGGGTWRATITSANTFSSDTDYYVEVGWDVVNDDFTLWVNNTQEADADNDLNSAIVPTSLEILSPVTNAGTLIDNFISSNSYTESLYPLRMFNSSQASGGGALCR